MSVDTKIDWPPAPPEGYRLHSPEYDQPWYVTTALAGWFFGMFVVVPVLVIFLKGSETTVRLAYAVFRYDNFTEWVVYLLWVLRVVGLLGIVHEGIHALCSRWFGFRVKFEVEYSNLVTLTPTTLTYGGLQSRGQSLAITLAPLVVLTPVSLFVLVASADVWVQASAVFIALGPWGQWATSVRHGQFGNSPQANSSLTTSMDDANTAR